MEPNPHEVAYPAHPFAKRMILRSGIRHYVIQVDEIAYCYSQDKITYLIDIHNRKYTSDKPLSHLETDLDPQLFFKINRNQIINLNHIRSYASFEKNRLKVELHVADKTHYVTVSQPKVVAFKDWILQQL